MFTGIISNQGTVLAKALEASGTSSAPSGLRLELSTGFSDIELGESISVNGVCLTVSRILKENEGEVLFFVSSETLERSNLGEVLVGERVNLERALTLQTRLSGHWVQGHVDGKGKLVQTSLVSGSHVLEIELPAHLSRYCIEKGSITLNGVSLTLNSVRDLPDLEKGKCLVQVMIIPFTASHTNLIQLRPGQFFNVEVDLVAKYVERLCHR